MTEREKQIENARQIISDVTLNHSEGRMESRPFITALNNDCKHLRAEPGMLEGQKKITTCPDCHAVKDGWD